MRPEHQESAVVLAAYLTIADLRKRIAEQDQLLNDYALHHANISAALCDFQQVVEGL
jgi:hypothetical protein